MGEDVESDQDGTSVRVAVRIRPLLGKEKLERCTECVVRLSPQVVMMMGKEKQFTFDHVFSQDSSQEEVYEQTVSPLVKNFFDGYNATVFAYGQTGSGKTYTMGTSAENVDAAEEFGIVPRAMSQIFALIAEKKQQTRGIEFYLRVQFLEVYGEEIRDLLDPAGEKTVSIRDANNGDGVTVVGACEELVKSSQDMLSALERGSLCRTTGSTNMNNHSSRSHAIFTIIIEQHIPRAALSSPEEKAESCREIPPDGEDGKEEEEAEVEYRTAKFHFVDLAGSERAKRTGATGTRLREGININMGLLALGNVISALGDETKRNQKGLHVPYRSSKLTRMLQDSLGGNSRTQMIACVSPADANFEETMNALRYANRARNIKNKPIVNRDPTSSQIAMLKNEISALRLQLRGAHPGAPGMDQVGSRLFANSAENVQVELDIAMRRAREAEEEVKRLGVVIEKEKRQRSEVQEKYVMCQAEIDFYKSKVDPGSVSAADIKTNAGYLRRIEDLQTQLQASDAELAKARREIQQIQSSAGPSFGSTSLRLDHDGSLDLSSSDELDVDEEGEELALEDIEADASDVEINEEDDEKTKSLKTKFLASQDNLKKMVSTYDVTLKTKQFMMKKVVEERKRYEAMKSHYEAKLDELNNEVRDTQKQRDELDLKIKDLEKRGNTSNKTQVVKLRTQLKHKHEKLRHLEAETRQLSEARKHAEKCVRKEREIQREIDLMKKHKVEYQRKMELNAKRYREETKARQREIAQLKKMQRKLVQEKSKLGARTHRDEMLIKQKTEQVTAMSRKLRLAQRLTTHNKQLTEKERKHREKIKKWAKERLKREEELENLQRAMRKKDEAMAKKEQLCIELERRKSAAEERAKRAEALVKSQQQNHTLFKPSPSSAGNIPHPTSASASSVKELFQSASSISMKAQEEERSAEEEEAVEELEQRLEAAESEVLFREQQCVEAAAKLPEDAEELEKTLKSKMFSSVPEAQAVLKELIQMYAESKKSRQELRHENERLKQRMRSSSAHAQARRRQSLISHSHAHSNGSAQMGIIFNHAQSACPSPFPLTPHKESPTMSGPGNSPLVNRHNELKEQCLVLQNENKKLKALLRKAGMDVENVDLDGKEIQKQLIGAKIEAAREQLRQFEVGGTPSEAVGKASSDRYSLSSSPRKSGQGRDVHARLANVDNFTGIHKRKAETRQQNGGRNSTSAQEHCVDELTLPSKSALQVVDAMVIDASKTDKIAKISNQKDKDAGPHSPSFARMTASHQQRIAQENIQRETKRESLGSESGRPMSALSRKDKRLSGAKDEELSAKLGRQMAWESVTGEKENKDSDYDSIHEKLSDPKFYTGVQKHKVGGVQDSGGKTKFLNKKELMAEERRRRKIKLKEAS